MHASSNIAKKFLDRAGQNHDLTPMKLLKLVYIAHGWMLGLHNRELIAEDVHAWQYGPVIPELYRKIKEYRDQPVQEITGAIEIDISPEEDDLIHQVFEKYGSFSGIKLSAMTHATNTPWHKIWHRDPWGEIPDDVIASYYRNLSRAA